MHSLVYMSSATRSLPSVELHELMDHSRTANQRLGITGVLLSRRGHYMQLLEGDEEKVSGLYAHICKDARHASCLLLFSAASGERMFTDWSMACRDLSDPAVIHHPSFSEFLQPGVSDHEFFADPTRAQRLLIHFKSVICDLAPGIRIP